MKKQKYATAIVFTSMIFFIGVLIGSKITNEHTTELQKQLQDDLLETQSLELEMSVVNTINKTSLCNYIDYRLPDIIKRKVELGRKFDINNIPDDQAELLKKQYLLSLSKYWLFSEVNKKQCGIRAPSIVFFFDDSEISREQGRILDYIVYKSNESVIVFSFNTLWDEPLMRLLMINYKITSTPTIVIDDTPFQGLQTRENITAALCKSYSTLCQV